MDHVLTEHGLRLTYLRNPSVTDDLDQDRILEDLYDDTLSGDVHPWFTGRQLTDHDHLILVTDRHSSRYLGVLGACDGTTASEDFLILNTAFVTVTARGQNLLRRMIALALLRIGSLGTTPSVIAACTHSPICYRILRGIAHRFTQATFFPGPGDVPINFHTATLAQRIAREIYPNSRFQTTTSTIRGAVPSIDPRRYRYHLDDPQIKGLFGQHMQPADRILAVLDLRGEDETTILDDARRLYRTRQEPCPAGASPRRTGHFLSVKEPQGVGPIAGTNKSSRRDRTFPTSAGAP
jgi:hypothetical protein